MKVFQVLNNFLPEQIAGTEVYTWALSKALQKYGVNVKVIIPNYGKVDSEDYIYDNLQVHKYTETSIVDRSLIMGFKNSNGLECYKKYIEEHKPDIVHFHEIAGSNGISLNHILAAKSTGTKIIFTFHLASNTCKTGSLIQNELSLCDGKIDINKCTACYLQTKNRGSVLASVSSLFYKLHINTTKWNSKIGTAFGSSFLIEKQKKDFETLINSCDQVVTLTKWYEKVLHLNGVSPFKINFIPQALPSSIRGGLINTEKDGSKVLKVIFLGRISHFKGLHLLIAAVTKLPFDKIRLDIYGQSENSDYEKILKEKSKVYSNIRWRGKLLQKNVLQTIQQYDILCLCSTFSEMSPLVIQEAFAAGVPVLASDVYGNSEQISHNKNGWLFKFKNEYDLQIQLQKLIDNPAMIEKAKGNIKPVRDFEMIAKEQLIVYKKAMA